VEIIEAVRVLVRIASDDLIAGLLNRNSLKTGYGNRWTRERVTSLRSHHKIPVYSQQVRESEGWMTLTQAAATLAVSAKRLRLAAERGEVVRLSISWPLVLGYSSELPSKLMLPVASRNAPGIPPQDMNLDNKTSIYQ
jgi:hypothetical protein